MKIQVELFWVVTPCSVVVRNRHFGGTCCLHVQGEVTASQPRRPRLEVYVSIWKNSDKTGKCTKKVYTSCKRYRNKCSNQDIRKWSS